MSVFIISQIAIRDRSRYDEYDDGWWEIFSKYEGKLLSVDEDPEVLEGVWPHTRTVVIEFPSKEKAMHWFKSDEYQKLSEIRHDASEGNIIIVEGYNDGDA